MSPNYWQSGIGDSNDLLLLSIDNTIVDSEEKWVPRINHGYFYDRQSEWYSFSDDLKIEYFYNNQLESGVHYKDLDFRPKPAVPIYVRRYSWDKSKQEYEIDVDLRKRVDFTGTNDADTTNDDGTIAFHNISSGLYDEFVVDYDYGNTPRIYTNKNYCEQFTTSGDFNNYELVGISDDTREVYNLSYSPVDASGQVEVISYLSSGTYTWWNKIDSNQAFNVPTGTNPWAYECKVDDILGTITFWSGCMPEAGSKIVARYTKGLLVEYEPENSRDYLFADTADTNPTRTALDKGFVSTRMVNPRPTFITLSSDYETGSNYQTDIDGPIGNVTALVKDIDGNFLEGIPITFEFLGPIAGSVNTETSMTNASGQAKTIYKPPTTVENIGAYTADVEVSGAYTLVTVEDLIEPTGPSGVMLYEVYSNDLILGIPSSGLNTYYEDYISDEGYEVNPVGTPAGVQSGIDFEVMYRDMFGLPQPTSGLLPVIASGLISEGGKLGKKQVYDVSDTGVISPHYGIEQTGGTNSPIWPVSFRNVGTTDEPILELIYLGDLEFDRAAINSFFAVVEGTDRVRAYFSNDWTKQRVYSNTISLDVNIPDKADGIFSFTTAADIPDNLFVRPYDVGVLPDSFIWAASGVQLYDAYWDERLPTATKQFAALTAIAPCIALYRFDGDYTDSGPNSVDASNTGTSLTTTNPYNAQSVQVSAADEYITANDLYQYIDMNDGTFELSYKAPYNGYLLGSGSSFEYLTHLIGQGSQELSDGTTSTTYDGIIIKTAQIGVTPYIAFDYIASGQAIGSLLQRGIRIDGTNLTDGEWHQIKMSWDFDQEDSLNSGMLGLDVWIDNLSVINHSGLMTEYIPQTMSSGLEYIVGFANSGEVGENLSAPGYYDEIRLSSGEQLDPTFQPDYGIEYEDYVTWFKRARKLDSQTMGTLASGLEEFAFSGTTPNISPVGFRFLDDNSEIASALDQRIFYDLNPTLATGLYDV
jgi:hypothetical protein